MKSIHNNGSRHWKTAGFTLSDLITIASVLLVFASFVIPVLKSAGGADSMSSCANNLRKVGQAVHMYADDWGGWAPAAFQAYPHGGGWKNWAIALREGNYLDCDIREDDGGFHRAESGRDHVFACPSPPPGQIRSNIGWHQHSTYGMRVKFGGYAPHASHADSEFLDIYRRNPRKILMADSVFRGRNSQWSIIGRASGVGGRIHLKHDEKANVQFIDGSVEPLGEDSPVFRGEPERWLSLTVGPQVLE